jgi:LPXTG-site transpeptidase (sortase) family protein
VTGVRAWLATALEWGLLGVGLGCLATYGAVSFDAHRVRQEQIAAFERAAAAQAAYQPAAGGLVGMLEVPRLRLSTPVIEGDDDRSLTASAGHLPDTPLPWQPGNSAIAGHRDGLFRPLKRVAVGDAITFRTTRDELHYRVTATAIVEPDDLGVLAPRASDALTLITCYPFSYVGPAPQRFVVHAERVRPTASAKAAKPDRLPRS